MKLTVGNIEIICFELMLIISILLNWHTDTIIMFMISALVIIGIRINEKISGK